MTTTPTSTPTPDMIELPPSYILPAVIILGGISVVFLQKWLGLAIALFGLFLLVQTATIRLQFSTTALDVYRSGKLIRNFPYQDWLNWEIFWPGVPILFYFREVKSIHFLPMLFNATMLRSCLEQRCGNLKQQQ